MKFIVYAQDPITKKLAIISPSQELSFDDIVKYTVPVPDYSIVENLFIDNIFFDAYEYENKQVNVNIEKAKEIWKDKFREARKPILEKLDIEYMRALETRNIQAQQEIITKKQALRQVTDIRLPDNLEDLKKTWPDILNQ